MRTFAVIIQCLFPLLLPVLSNLQGRRGPRFMKFYRAMAEKAWTRKGFVLLLTALLLLWNYSCFATYPFSVWLLPSFPIPFFFLVHEIAHAILALLSESRERLYMASILVLAMVLMHVTLGLPQALVSLYGDIAIVIGAACLYPTRDVIFEASEAREGTREPLDDDELYRIYFLDK